MSLSSRNSSPTSPRPTISATSPAATRFRTGSRTRRGKRSGSRAQTWKLEVVADPENPATLGKQFTKQDGTAIDFATLLKLGEKHAVRFAKVMTCLNIGCPLGMGIWEGVPLRDIVWLTQPKQNLRRVFYYGYHNDDPKQMFRSSLPVGRVLEDYDDLPPVIVCYKLNGEWLSPQRGGPVRILVPGALRLQVGEVADAHRAVEPLSRQRHLRHAEQRRR